MSFSPALHAADLHVSPSGKDSNPGTQAAPYRTIGAARDAARKLAGKEPVTVHLADGVYYLPETLVFTPADSGTAKAPSSIKRITKAQPFLAAG